MHRRLTSALILASALAACGDDGSTTSEGAGGAGSGSGGATGAGGDASTPTSTGVGPGSGGGATTTGAGGGASSSSSTSTSSASSGTGGGGACREPAPADRDRFVVVGLPYGDGEYVTDYAVLRLTTEGVLEPTGTRFQMGSAEVGTIAFTPDGRIGAVAQRGGTLGVFSIDEAGAVTVIDPAFQPGDFYAGALASTPSGDAFIVANANWPESGGGLYRVAIDCQTGEPSLEGRQIETKNAWALLSLGGDRWAVAGRAAGAVEDATDVFDLRAGDPWTRAGGTNAFDYADSLPGGFAAARDGSFLLVGDISEFSGVPTNVRFVSVDASGFTAQGAELDVEDPFAIAVSPAGDVALVASGYGDAIFVVDVDPGSGAPLSVREELEYADQGAQLPGPFVGVERGSLDGLVLNVDIEGLRTIRFTGGGQVEDQGLTSVGEGVAGLVAAVGIQP